MTFRQIASSAAASGVALLLLASGPGWAAAQTPRSTGDMTPDELEALFRARSDSALMRVSEADVQFMTGMIGHHAQAIVISTLAPDAGASPQIRTLAARIINAQNDEIALMQRWLRDRGRPAPEVDDSGHMDHAMNMPGMLSPEQLDELAGARGPAFDRLFLAYMIQHHEGAVVMVEELFNTDGAALDDTSFQLASAIQVDQITEIVRMRSMLRAMREPSR